MDVSGVNEVYDPGDNLMNDLGINQRCDLEINNSDINSASNKDLNSVCNSGLSLAFEPCNYQVLDQGVPQVLDPEKTPLLDPSCSQVCDLGVTQVSDSQMCFPEINLCDLPDSLLLEIFLFLDAHDVAHIAQVCRRLYYVAYDESVWRQLACWRWKLNGKPAQCRCLWRLEYQRLSDNVPNVLSETLTDHTDEVLHVSFSHDGTLFSTTSKDCTIKVWEVGLPTTLKYSQDFRTQFHWDFTQFSCFNATDTMLLVSSVKTAELDRRGYVAILSITHDFQLLQVLSMDPSQLFGTWMNPNKFLGGSLEISLERFITTVQIKAFEVDNIPPSPDTDVSLRTNPGETLFTFSSENASLIKFLTVVNNPCVSQSCTKQNGCLSGEYEDHVEQGHKVHIGQEYEGHLGQGHKCHLGQGHKCHLHQGQNGHLCQEHKCHLSQRISDVGCDFESHLGQGHKGNSGQEHKCNLGNENVASTSDTANIKLPGKSNSHTSDLCTACTSFSGTSDRNTSNNNSQEGHQHSSRNLDILHSSCVSSLHTQYEFTSDELQTEDQTKSNDQKHLESSICSSDCSLHDKSPCLRENPMKTSVEVKQEEGAVYSKLCFCCRKRKNSTTVQHISDFDERVPLSSECNDNQSDTNRSRNKQWEDCEMADGDQERLVLEGSCQSNQSEYSIIGHKADLVDHEMTDSNQEIFRLTSKCNDEQVTPCTYSQADCANRKPRYSEDWNMEDSAQDRFLLQSECDVYDASDKDLQTEQCQDRTRQSGECSMSDSLLTPESCNTGLLYIDSIPDNCKDNTRHSGCDHYGHCSLDSDQQGHWSPVSDQQGHWSPVCDQQGHCLIYVTGEFAVALHQLGFKALCPVNRSSSKADQERSSPQLDLDNMESHMVVNYSNQLIEMQQVRRPDAFDHLIDLNGHITGLCLSRDHRYLFVNCRPWVGPVDRSDPWSTPELSTEIEVRVIDLCTMEMCPLRYVGHKGLSPSTMCCFIFLDTSDDFVGSGSEDTKAYVWERRYGCVVAELSHGPGVVNAVAFCPNNQEYLVTVSDDNNIRIWRSKHSMRLLSNR